MWILSSRPTTERKPKKTKKVTNIEKAMEHEGDGDINFNLCTWNDPQKFSKRSRGVRNQRTSWDNPNYSIVEARSDYWEESWWPGVNCCHSNTSNRPSANADVKNVLGVIYTIYIYVPFVFFVGCCFQDLFSICKLADNSQGQLEGSLFNSYYTEV